MEFLLGLGVGVALGAVFHVVVRRQWSAATTALRGEIEALRKRL